MPIYVYETTGPKKRQFEVKQSMMDEPLRSDPETGEPVRRVISGGYGIMSGAKPEIRAPKGRGHGGCCGGGCGCH
jgi:hypothetical protein